MKTTKKLLALLLALSMTFALAACGGNDDAPSTDDGGEPQEKTVTLHMGGGLTSSSPQYEHWVAFAEAVKERSNGTLNISVDLSGALGSDREIIEGVMNGSIEMMQMSDGSVATVITDTGFVALPFLFPTRETAEEHYFNGELGRIYKEILAENNITLIGNIIEGDPRWMSNSIREISKPEDLAGLKIRVMDNPMWVSYFTKLGCNPIAMSVSEVAAALQQKVIDGQDNGPMNTYFYGFYEFQNYMTKTNHGYAANYICINTDILNSLSENQRTILLECADEFSAKAYEGQKAAVDEIVAEMDAAGMKTIECTPELEEFLRAAAAEIWNDESLTSTYNAEAMEYIRSNLA